MRRETPNRREADPLDHLELTGYALLRDMGAVALAAGLAQCDNLRHLGLGLNGLTAKGRMLSLRSSAPSLHLTAQWSQIFAPATRPTAQSQRIALAQQ